MRVRTVLKFKSSRKKRQERKAESETRNSTVRLARLMALAIYFEDMLERGEVADRAELARQYGVAGAQISRIMMLNLLAPDLQAKLLGLGEEEPALCLKHVLPVCRETDWRHHQELYVIVAS